MQKDATNKKHCVMHMLDHSEMLTMAQPSSTPLPNSVMTQLCCDSLPKPTQLLHAPSICHERFTCHSPSPASNH
jgi:hypothetical protein